MNSYGIDIRFLSILYKRDFNTVHFKKFLSMKTKLLIITLATFLFGWDISLAQFTGSTGRGDVMHEFAYTPPPPTFFLAENGVTILCPDAAVGETGVVNGITYTKRDRNGLLELRNQNANNPEFVTSCTTGVTNISFLFSNSSSFNQDISTWDVSGVTNMNSIFNNATAFNQDIGNWDVSNVTSMRFMFYVASAFNQDIGDWNVSNVTDMTQIFFLAISFNQDIGNWDVGNVNNMNGTFQSARAFNQDISEWNVENVTNMALMFSGANAFNQDIGNWDVKNVTNMRNMFNNAFAFNQDIGNWDVKNVTNMQDMFFRAEAFNQNIGNWDVSNVTNMNSMFFRAESFNQDIGEWNVSNVTDMTQMFLNALVFNQNISNWDVSNVTSMGSMFFNARVFNQDIGNWDVSNVINMDYLLYSARAFNRDLSGWCVIQIPTEPNYFDELATAWTLPNSRPVWGTCPQIASLPGPYEGWRMLGAPVSGATYANLLDGLWTQGFPGASFAGGVSNVYWYNEAQREFTVPAAASNIVGSSSDAGFNNAGRGFVAYIYEDDFNDGTSTEWPKGISISGLPYSGDSSVSFSNTVLPGDDEQGWHIASNPYRFPISWTSMVADNALENMLPILLVFDANANSGDGGYRVNYGFNFPNLPGTIAHDGIIAPFQAFWVRTDGTEPVGSINFNESFEATGGTLFDTPELPQFLALSVEGQNLEASAIMIFRDALELSTNKPVPFSPEKIRFGFLREGNQQPDIFRSMEVALGDERIIPLDFAAVNSGTFVIKLDENEFSPLETMVTLRDHLTGAEHHLSPDNPYTFIYDAQQELASNKEGFNPKTALMDSKSLLLESEHRFELHIQLGNATSTEPVSELPKVVALDQNYPNPFNPTTQIQYALPESGSVRLDVFNVMGQRVATLVNDQKPAGYHTVTFDARRLASGTYVYRLQMGNHVITKKLLLIK